MKSRLIKPMAKRNPGDVVEAEERLEDIKFTVTKITGRKRPDDPRRNLIFPCFSEFGSEIVASMYCIPKL